MRRKPIDRFLDRYIQETITPQEEQNSLQPYRDDNYGLPTIHQGDITNHVEINIYINSKKRIPSIDELYQEILRKRGGGDYR